MTGSTQKDRGEERGLNFFDWLFAGFLLTLPIVGYVLLIDPPKHTS